MKTSLRGRPAAPVTHITPVGDDPKEAVRRETGNSAEPRTCRSETPVRAVPYRLLEEL